MRKTNTIKNKVMENQHKKDITPTPSSPIKDDKKEDKKDDMKIEEEDNKITLDCFKPDSIHLDDPIKLSNPNEINLDEEKEKKHKKKYDLDDTVHRDIILSNEIHVRLLSNINGYFVDFRRYFRGYPSQKGIRIAVGKYIQANEYLMKDIAALNLPK